MILFTYVFVYIRVWANLLLWHYAEAGFVTDAAIDVIAGLIAVVITIIIVLGLVIIIIVIIPSLFITRATRRQ
jgi:hypothetical protein